MTAQPVRVDYQVILAKLQETIGKQAGELAVALATVDALQQRNAELEDRIARDNEDQVADEAPGTDTEEKQPDDDYPAGSPADG